MGTARSVHAAAMCGVFLRVIVTPWDKMGGPTFSPGSGFGYSGFWEVEAGY